MNGQTLIDRVRVMLRDETSDVQKGEFWSDEEIILSLNNAQDVWLNFLFRFNHYHLLGSLHEQVSITEADLDANDIALYPADYLHYVDCYRVFDVDIERPMRVYEFDNIAAYEAVSHDCLLLSALGIRFNFYDNPATFEVKLGYYKTPTTIIAGDFDNSWNDDVYEDVLANYAVMLLGLKEPQNNRGIRKVKRFYEELSTEPKIFANYTEKHEIPPITPVNQYVR